MRTTFMRPIIVSQPMSMTTAHKIALLIVSASASLLPWPAHAQIPVELCPPVFLGGRFLSPNPNNGTITINTNTCNNIRANAATPDGFLNSGTININSGTLRNIAGPPLATITNNGSINIVGGFLSNGGNIVGTGDLSNSSSFYNGPSATFALLGNYSAVDPGSTITNDGVFMNCPGGVFIGGSTFFNNNGTYRNEGYATNTNTFNNNQGALFTNALTFINAAGPFNNTGTVINTTSGHFNFINTATLNNRPGATLTNLGEITTRAP